MSASPASDFTSGGFGGGGVFSGSGMSSGGSVASGPLMSSRQGATVIEIWLAEPYQVSSVLEHMKESILKHSTWISVL